MKYGETLRQRSIPAWSHHNIDYDDIKHFIKERTTPGKGKTVSVPGRGDENLVQFENALFLILEDQHQRINLFVRSKAGEIQRRLDHVKKQLKQLSSRTAKTADHRIPIRRLERYGKLENDVLKAGDEIRSLSRFTGAQRTAFRKLLKKFKKWTGSTTLEARFRTEVLDDPKSFTKLDLGSMLDDYSETLQSIRSLYEDRVQQATKGQSPSEPPAASQSSVIARLQAALRRSSNVDFDTAIATIPLGELGTLASYFIHLENVVELQVLLLQYLEYFSARSRSNSIATPVSTTDQAPHTTETATASSARNADYFMLVADDLDRFAQEESALTVDEREHLPGLPPQRAKAFIRWNNEEDAMLSTRRGRSQVNSTTMKRKQINSLFDNTSSLTRKKSGSSGNERDDLSRFQDDVLADKAIRPLYKICTCRSRFKDIKNNAQSFTMAALDTAIIMEKAPDDVAGNSTSAFPFAVLQVRQEGRDGADLIAALDRSHLVERVRGFSLQYHALWQIYKPPNISPPFWLPMLSRDIRKLPPPAVKQSDSTVGSGSGSQSATRRSVSTPNSLLGSSTVVDTDRPSSSNLPDILETPPLKSFRKKRRRPYAQRALQPQERYWSEYDHPEDGTDGNNAYVIYIDPNEKSRLDRLIDRVGGFLGRRQPEEEPLLSSPSGDDSSDEEEVLPKHQASSYGTDLANRKPPRSKRPTSLRCKTRFLPPLTIICLIASIAILIVAYILATTSKHKYATEADAGIIFAIACSLAFAILGCIPLLNRRDGSWLSIGVALAVLIIDAVFSGFLLARMLG